MPTAVQWATIKVKLPREMIYVDEKTGKVSLLANPLTKSGNLAKKGQEWSIQLETDPHIDKPEIVDEGNKINTFDAKERGKKYKGQIKEAKENKTDMLSELKKEAGKVRTRAIVPVNGERAIIPLNTEKAIVPVGERSVMPVEQERAIIPLNREEETPPARQRRGRRPRLQPVDVNDGGLDRYTADLDAAPIQGTLRPIDGAIQKALSRLNHDLNVSSRRYTAFEELRGIGRRGLDSEGVEEHKSPESHEILRQRQEGRRVVAFEQLKDVGQKALQDTRRQEKIRYNMEHYQQNRQHIRRHRNEQITCEVCGGRYMRTNQARHLKSKRHQDAL